MRRAHVCSRLWRVYWHNGACVDQMNAAFEYPNLWWGTLYRVFGRSGQFESLGFNKSFEFTYLFEYPNLWLGILYRGFGRSSQLERLSLNKSFEFTNLLYNSLSFKYSFSLLLLSNRWIILYFVGYDIDIIINYCVVKIMQGNNNL